MSIDLDQIIGHTGDDDCPACRAQDIANGFVVPAVLAWELAHGLPRLSLAIHGAAGLLGAILEEGHERGALEEALADMLDEIERAIEEDNVLGGPPQGSA